MQFDKMHSLPLYYIRTPPSVISCDTKMKYAISILVIFGVFCASYAEVNLCENVANMMFLPYVGNCSKYYVCVDNEAIPQDCESGYFFDASSQSCTDPDVAQCLPTCTSALSSFCYERTCTKYVLCYAGVPVVRQCCDGLQYNADTDRCDFAEYVDCVDNLCTVFDSDPNDITFLSSKGACDKYFICQEGQALEQSCSKGLQFNSECNCCDFPSNVNCSITALQRNILPYSKAPPRSADITCPAEGVHFQAHTLPDRYYFCMNGKGVILECTPGLIYDSALETCREPKNVKPTKV